MRFSFGKKDKLKSKKIIDALFSEGKSVSAYPLRLVYLQSNFDTSIKTEDIELSTRLQVNGCKIMYIEDAIASTVDARVLQASSGGGGWA